MVSDFAVFLTILTMVILDFLIGVPSPKLQVPSVFKVSRPRGLCAASRRLSQVQEENVELVTVNPRPAEL